MLDLGIDFVREHFEVQSKVVGYPIGVPEGVVNDLGYAALSAGKTADAIALFRRNGEANPNSANSWDSLADGYAKAGRWQDAAEASDHAVDLAVKFDDPHRASFVEHAKKMHDRLSEMSKGEEDSH